MVFSVGPVPRLYSEDPRPGELIRESVENWYARDELCEDDLEEMTTR
jgi:hypothetical protein